MSESAKVENFSESFRAIMYLQCRMLDFLIHELINLSKKNRREKEIIDTVFLMIQGVGVSVHSIRKLTAEKDMAIRDCFGISRSISETAINICYIGAIGLEAAQKAQRHARQKFFRNLSREDEVGTLKIKIHTNSYEDPEKIPELKEALLEFTSNKNREKNWTDLAINERILKVEKFDPIVSLCLGMAYVMIHRNASEILHGTYYGTMFFWDGIIPITSTKRTPGEHWENNFLAIAMATISSIYSVVRVFSKRYNLNNIFKFNEEIFNEFKKNIQKMAEEQESANFDKKI